MRHEDRCVGLSLETLTCSIARPENVARPNRVNRSCCVPPSVVCVSPSSQQFQLDQWFPANPIGSGESWPREAQVHSGCSRRMPLGLLWDLGRRERQWQVDESTTTDPMHGLAIAARDAIRGIVSIDSVGLVIPNWLRQSQQQRLLESLSGSGLKWRLVWRPIAAATYWISHFFRGLRLGYSKREPIGRILCLHLGLFECEWTIVELVAEPNGVEVVVLPARRRTATRTKIQEHQPGILSDILVRFACSGDGSLKGQANA